jgi:hypothetical protein
MLKILFLILLSQWAYAATYIHSLANGASNVTHDYFCNCKKVSNSSGKNVMIPHRTSLEWTDFYTYPPTNVTTTTCIGTGSGVPVFDFTDVSESVCKGATNEISVGGRNNSLITGVIVNIDSFTGAAFASHCDIFVLQNNVSTPFTDGMTVNVCQNDNISVKFLCDAGTYSTSFKFTDVTTSTVIDTFAVTISSASGCR